MSKAKILWVDDQIDLLKSHIIFLNEKGYQIDSCTNGSDALDKISNNRYDVIPVSYTHLTLPTIYSV